MPIDPSIALSYRPPVIAPPEIQTPLERFGRILTLKNLMQTGQLKDIQLQEAQAMLKEHLALPGYLASLNPQQPAGAQPNIAPAGTPSVVTTPFAPAGMQTTPQPLIGGVPEGAFWMPQAAATPVSPVAPAPPAGTVSQTAPAGTPAPAAAAAEPPLSIPLIGGGAGAFPNINWGKFLTDFPRTGGAIAKNFAEQEKVAEETRGKRLENDAKFHTRIANDAQSVLDAKDPELAKNEMFMQLHTDGFINDATTRDWTGRPFNRDTFERLARSASDRKTQIETTGKQIENLQKENANVAQDLQGVSDQAGWDRVYPRWSPAMQQKWGNRYSPEIKAMAISRGIDPDKYPKFRQDEIQGYAARLAAAMKQGQDVYQAELAKLPLHDQSMFLGATTPEEITDRVRTFAEQETVRHNRREEELTAQGHTNTQASQIASQEDKLRDDYRQDSGKFTILRDAYDRIKTVGRGTPTAAGDIALLYNYMKLIDPTARVPEGKAATAENAGSLPDWVVAQYNRLVNGEKLSDNMRNNFLTLSEDIYRAGAKNQEDLNQKYRDTAQRRGLNADNIIVDTRSTLPPGQTSAPAAVQGQPKYRTGGRVTRNGKTYEYIGPMKGDDWRDSKNWTEVH